MKKGDIVAIPFPLNDLTGSKIRPALILANSTRINLNRFLLIPSLLLLFFTSCKIPDFNPQEKQSRLIELDYGGYGDTLCASLNGIVYEGNSSNQIPLGDVKISFHCKSKFIPGSNAWKHNNNDTIRFTNSSGMFSIGFFTDTISMTISKKGYQTLLLINYEATGDQYTNFKAALSKGNGIVIEDIGKQAISKKK